MRLLRANRASERLLKLELGGVPDSWAPRSKEPTRCVLHLLSPAWFAPTLLQPAWPKPTIRRRTSRNPAQAAPRRPRRRVRNNPRAGPGRPTLALAERPLQARRVKPRP